MIAVQMMVTSQSMAVTVARGWLRKGERRPAGRLTSLLLGGMEVLTVDRYRDLANMEADALGRGYRDFDH